MSLESRSNSQDSDYELMQQYSGVGTRIQRGHSVREQPPLDSQQAPQYKPPYPPRKSRISPNRWRNYHRLSSGRTKNCAGPQDLRRMEGDYAVPRIRSDTEGGGVYASPRISRETEGRRYDGFFRGSIAEEGEGEGGEGEEYERGSSSIGSMVVVPEKQQQCYCRKVLLGFVLVLLLSIALAGLGLALFNKITRNSHNSVPVSDTMCDSTAWCGVTVTMAAHTTNCTPCINSSITCKTEPLLTNITGLTPLRFHCTAGDTTGVVSYQNAMYREEESVHCVCTYSSSCYPKYCTVVGDYCSEQGQDNNSTNSTSFY